MSKDLATPNLILLKLTQNIKQNKKPIHRKRKFQQFATKNN